MGRARRLLPMLSFTNSAEADQTEPKEGKRGRFRNLGHLIEPSLERAASSLPTTQPSVGGAEDSRGRSSPSGGLCERRLVRRVESHGSIESGPMGATGD